MIPSHLGESQEAFKVALEAFKVGGDEMAIGLDDAMRSVDGGNTYTNYVKDAGLFMHTPGRGGAIRLEGAREEAFLSSLAGNIPWIRGSERAYTTFLNKLRWDAMDKMVKNIDAVRIKEGAKPISGARSLNKADKELLKDMASFINASTGRGPLPKQVGKNIASIMNAMMFSPRLFTSRLAAPAYAGKIWVKGAKGKVTKNYVDAIEGQEIALNGYAQMSKAVAWQLGLWFGTGSLIMFLANHMPGVDVGTDPRSSDFGKIRIGDSRVDIWSGYTQIASSIARLATRERVSASTGEVMDAPIWEEFGRFARSKFSPTAGLVVEYNLFPPLTGTEGETRFGKGVGFLGEDRDILKDMRTGPIRFDHGLIPGIDEESFWTRYFIPLFLRDLSDVIDNELNPITIDNENTFASPVESPSLVKGIGIGALKTLPVVGGLLGMGVSTFKTLDDIAAEMTKNQRGGPKKYAELMLHERRRAQDIRKGREKEKGITRTTGVGYGLEKSRQDESEQYLELERQLRNREIDVKTARDKYFKIRGDSSQERRMLAKEYFGEDEKNISAMRSPAEIEVEKFYSRIDELQKRSGVTIPLGSSEYDEALRQWETEMISSGREGAVIALRMQSHLADIPEGLLSILPQGTRARYRAARILRNRYRSGEMKTQTLYER